MRVQWPGDESDLEAMIEGRDMGNGCKIMAMSGRIRQFTVYFVLC